MQDLQNSYWALRHGHSLSNQKKIISSRIDKGGGEHYLTTRGIKEVTSRAFKMHERFDVIVASDFLRAQQSAQLIKEGISFPGEIILDPRLRERDFGNLDGLNVLYYAKVWRKDRQDATHTSYSVEAVSEVAGRLQELIHELEVMHQNKKILLVAHGDVIQILTHQFEKKDLRAHRNASIKTAGLRRLIATSE